MAGNIEAEQVVLGTLLNDPKAAHFVKLLHVDDFVERMHRLIFEAIEAASAEGRFASPVVLAPQFARDQVAEGVNGAVYLVRLGTAATSRDLLPDYIRALKELAGRRVLAELAQEMARIAKSPSAALQPFAERTVEAMDDILAGLRRQKVSSWMFDELAQSRIDQLRSGEKPNLIDTGLLTLNKAIGGFGRGYLVILAGRPSMGKTTIALSAMRQAAKRGTCALFFSLEMPGAPVTDRLLSDAVFNSQTPIHYSRIITGDLHPHEIDRLDDIRQAMAGMPLRIDEQTGLSVSEMAVRARRYADQLAADGRKLDTIWIDHLGFVKASDRYSGNRVNEISDITKSLRALAKELDVAIILLCQLNREVERRDSHKPQLADLRDSGAIEEDADIVMFAFREAYYLGRMAPEEDSDKEIHRQAKLERAEKLIEIVCPKTRNGAIFNRRFFADMGSNAVRDLA